MGAWKPIKSSRKFKTGSKRFKKNNKVVSMDDFERLESQFKERPKKVKPDKPKRQRFFSVGEAKIKKYLIKHNISFIQEYNPRGCKNPKTNMKLFYDFYIPDINTVIEYDGYQHRFKPSTMTQKDFLDYQYRDRVKNKFCMDNKINIIRIPSTEKDHIEGILNNIFNLPN